MATDTTQPLFPQTDLFNLGTSSNDLFSNPTPAATPTITPGMQLLAAANKPLTTAQLKQQALLNRQQQIATVTNSLQQMRADPSWQDASLNKRTDMYNDWFKNTYQPAMRNIQDPDLRSSLMSLPQQVLKPDITNLQQSINNSSRIADTAKGTLANGIESLSTVTHVIPATIYQANVDRISNYINSGQQNPAVESEITDSLPGDLLALKNQGASWPQILQAAQTSRNNLLQSATQAAQQAQAVRATQSIGEADRQRELAEEKQAYGPVLGTLANARHISNDIQNIVEQLPNALPIVAGSALAGPVGGAATGAATIGAGALQSAVQAVQGLSDQQLQQLPQYKALRDSGVSETDAKNTLALRAGSNAGLLGAIAGLATGPFGAEAGVGSLVGRAVGEGAADVAGSTVGGAIGRAAARTAATTGVQAAQQAGMQLASNIGQQQATGGNNPLGQGVAEAATQGALMGLPISGLTEGIRAVQEGEGTPSETPVPPTEPPPSTEGQVPAVPTAADAAAQVQAEPVVPVTEPAAPTPSAERVASLQATMNDLRSRAGTALTQDEITSLMPELYNAQAEGISTPAIKAGLDSINQVRAMPEDHPNTSLADAYQAYTDERTNLETAQLATPIVNALEQPTAAQNADLQSITATDNASPPTSADINRAMETDAPESGATPPTVSTDAGATGESVEAAGISGAGGDGTTASVGDETATGQLGADTTSTSPVSGSDNQPVPVTNQEPSAGERDVGSAAAEGAGYGGSAAESGAGAIGRNVTVGEPVTYEARTATGAPRQVSGTVTQVNPDGTFNMRTPSGMPLERLSSSNIVPSTEQTPVTATASETTGLNQEPTSETSPVETGVITPAGRNVQDLSGHAQTLDNYSDGQYAANGQALTQAIQAGDHVAADTIADSLWQQGLQQFKAPQENSGDGASSVDTAFNNLSDTDRLAAQRGFISLQGILPPELSTFKAFREGMVADALRSLAGDAPLSNIFNRLTDAVKAVFVKLAQAIGTVAVALSLSHTSPITDARAAEGLGHITQVTDARSMSHEANVVNSWVRQSKDNAGQRYIIADKVTGKIHIVDATGKVLATASALYGEKLGDGYSLGETPAGVFTLRHEAAPAAYGGDLEQFGTAPNGDIYAIHRVLTNNPRQRRLQRLESPNAAAHRISLGCINIPSALYDKYLSKGFNGKLYIIPDQKNINNVFKGIEETQAKENLRPEQQLPQQFNDAKSQVYQSSTEPNAVRDTARIKPVTGTAMTAAATESDLGTATSSMAALSNDPLDRSLAGLGLFPFLSTTRVRRRLFKLGKKGESFDADPDVEKENPTSGLGPTEISKKDFHRVTATNQDLANDEPESTHGWLAETAAKTMERLSDSHYRFTQWTNDVGLAPKNGEFDATPANQTLKLMPNSISALRDNLAKQYFKPVSDLITKVSTEKGVSPDVVGVHMGVWSTMQHIPEANRELRKTLQAEVDQTMFSGDEAAHSRARTALQAFDNYQRGVGDPVKMAGGLTDAQAQVIAKRIEGYGYNAADLKQANQHIVDAFEGLTQKRLEKGVLLPEEVEQWKQHNFKNYVALYVDQNRDSGDVFIGANNFNPTGDYTREGSLTPANHALITLHQYLYRTAAGIESQRFKYELHQAYGKLGEGKGLSRVAMTPFTSLEDRTRPGFMYTMKDTDADNNPTRSTYKYYFDDPRITDGILKKTNEPSWAVLKGLAALTSLHAKAMTKYDPRFAPILWVKDAWERATSLSSRKILDSKGNVLPLSQVAPRLFLTSFNPIHVATLLTYLQSKGKRFADSRIAKGFEELRQQGGVSTYQNALSHTRDGLRTELKKLKGPRKSISAISHFFTNWSEAFGAAPAAASYLTLKEMGVAPRDAAFRSLDVMNSGNSGTWTANMRAFAPFIAPSIEGGRNMVRTLSSRRGLAVVGAQVALAATAYQIALAAAPDDPDKGNLLDGMKLDDISRFIPLFNPDGSYEKLPVAFGVSRLAWMLGAGASRLLRGIDSPGDFTKSISLTLLQELQPFDVTQNVQSDNVAAGVIGALIPSILTPVYQLALNQNNFGGRIHGEKAPEGYASDSAMAKTPQIWTTIAQGLSSATGGTVDMYPESMRHLFQSYLVGPARAVNTALEANTLYTTGGQMSTRQQIGWLGDLLGLQSFYDNGNNGTSRMYYNWQDKATDIMHQYHVSAAQAGTPAGGKAAGVAQRLLDAGATSDEAALVSRAVQAETDRQKLNTQMKQKIKQYTKADIDLSDLAPDYEDHAQKTDELMRGFIRDARGLQ